MTTGGDAVLPLLATKLHAPRRRQGVVARATAVDPRVRARRVREEHARRGAVRRRRDDRVAVPRRARRRAARFWTYVVAALRAVEPEVGADAHALLDAGQFDPDVVLAALLNDLQAL